MLRRKPLNGRLTVSVSSSQRQHPVTIRDPMRYTLGQAAKATGLSKMTIQRALKSGRLSGHKDDTGSYQIDPSELHRVFPAVTAGDSNEAVTVGRSETPAVDTALQVSYARLEAENAALKTMLEDMRTERDRWHEQAQRLALAPPQRRRSWWPWGRGSHV
jgi:excisionase family DNA binding protein